MLLTWFNREVLFSWVAGTSDVVELFYRLDFPIRILRIFFEDCFKDASEIIIGAAKKALRSCLARWSFCLGWAFCLDPPYGFQLLWRGPNSEFGNLGN